MDIFVDLTAQEITRCRQWAREWVDEDRQGGFRKHGGSRQGLLADHIRGLLAEVAVERYLGLPGRTRKMAYREYHFDSFPPGAVQVRSCSEDRHGLPFIPAKNNCPACPYLLAYIPDGSHRAHLRGWATGEQVMAKGRLIETTGFPFYVLPSCQLQPVPEQPHPYFYLDKAMCKT